MKFSFDDITQDDYRLQLENYQRGILVVDAELKLVYLSPVLAELLGRPAEELLGGHPLTLFGLPDDSLPWDAPRELEARDSVGHRRFLRWRALGAKEPWRIVALLDVTGEVRAQRRSQALFQVASRLTLTTCVKGRLNEVARHIVQATQAHACSVLLISEDMRLRAVGTDGLPDSFPTAIGQIFDQNEFTVCAIEAFRTRKPQVAASGSIRDLARNFPPPPELADYLARATWTKVYSVPLCFQERALGTLNCYYDDEDSEPEEEMMPFLQAVADVVAVSVENSRLFDEWQGKAVLEERQRIARELHDSVSQALYGISLGARTTLIHLDEHKLDPARESLRYVMSLAEAGLSEMRSLIFELRPDSLESEGLVGPLERQLTALEHRYGLKVEAHLLEPPVPVEVKHSLYRVIQEALGNVSKHAKARQVRLSMWLTEQDLCVSVADDGIGFRVDENHPGHYGLKTMSERVAQHHGRIHLDSAPDRGTTVSFELPLQSAN